MLGSCSGGFKRPCPRRLLAVVAGAFARHHVGATRSCSDIGGRIVSPSAPATERADDHQYAASPATSEWRRRRPTAGSLTAESLPIPDGGGETAVLEGSDEEGFEGNGTWVHARDPRYAAQDVITLGCATVTRDDYTDPVAALEGNYHNRLRRPRRSAWYWNLTTNWPRRHYFELYLSTGPVLYYKK